MLASFKYTQKADIRVKSKAWYLVSWTHGHNYP